MISACIHDRHPCPSGGCSTELCARHEFVPVVPTELASPQLPARSLRRPAVPSWTDSGTVGREGA